MEAYCKEAAINGGYNQVCCFYDPASLHWKIGLRWLARFPQREQHGLSRASTLGCLILTILPI